MSIRQQLTLSYLRHLLATPKGRAYLLSQVADAESSGEARIFDQALAKVDDPELAKMISKHQADEIRHGELFRACESRTGLPPRTVPNELKLIDRLDRRLGNPLSRPIEDRTGVMEAYLLLQVVEERAIEQFDNFIVAFREVDPETAKVFEEVRADEERHLKYCHAISSRYAPDEETRLKALARLRREEGIAYAENQLANMNYTLDHGLMRGTVRRAFWRAMAFVASARREIPVTSFARETAHLVPAAA